MAKIPPASAGDTRDMVQFLDQEGPLEKETAAHSVFLPGEFHGQRILMDYSPCGPKESETTERLTHQHYTPIIFFKIFVNVKKEEKVKEISCSGSTF